MSNKDMARVVIQMEAEVGRLRRDFDKANKVVEGSTNKMQKASSRAAQKMQKDMAAAASKMGDAFKNFGKGLFAGIAAGGIAGILGQFRQIAGSVARIGDEAKRAGLGIREFQELKYVAEQNRVGVDSLVDGIKELNLRADEFITTGKGSAAEAFARLGYGGQELANKLRDPSALFTEIIGKLQQLDRASAIRIADEIFGGTGGEKFVQLIDQGEQGIRDTIKAAHELGIVMDDEVIKRADELDRKFDAITTAVGTGLKTAIVEAAGALQNFINTFNGMWERYQERLKGAEMGRMVGAMAGQKFTPQLGPAPTKTTPKTDRLPRADAPYTPPPPPGGGTRNKAAEDAEREAAAVRRLIDELQEELRLVGATNTEREIANTLRRAGVDATSKEGQQIAALVTQIEAETEARQKQAEAVAKQQQATENLFQMGADALTSMVDGSMKAEEAVKRLAVQLALAAAQAALLGSGPLAGLFGGGLFGGGGGFVPNTTAGAFFTSGFADGGYTGRSSFTNQPKVLAA